MIDQLSTILFTTTSLKTEVSQEFLRPIDAGDIPMDLGEGIESLEGQSLFMHYLLGQHSPPFGSLPSSVKQQLPDNFTLSLPRLSEGAIIKAEGQELPSAGNRLPLLAFDGADPKHIAMPSISSTEVTPATERTVISLTAVNRASDIIQTPDHVIDVRPGSSSIHQTVSNRVVWMINQNVQAAELRVNPPQLGPVEVRISLEGEQTNVSLIAQHSAVREVMESAIPRLREMLAESGLNSVNIDVSQHDLSQRRHEASRFLNMQQEISDSSENHSEANAEHGNIQRSSVGLGLIDYFV
jgi:flagellar hook-length control protein FliK